VTSDVAILGQSLMSMNALFGDLSSIWFQIVTDCYVNCQLFFHDCSDVMLQEEDGDGMLHDDAGGDDDVPDLPGMNYRLFMCSCEAQSECLCCLISLQLLIGLLLLLNE